MRYFYKLLDNVMVLPLMAAIARRPDLWDKDKTRTLFEGTPHAQVNDIILRCSDLTKPLNVVYNDLETFDQPAMRTLPMAKGLALNVMQIIGASRLGRVIITKLEPGRK